MNFTWKDWQSAQNIQHLYETQPFLYFLYMLFLALQSFIAFLVLVLVIVLLAVLTVTSHSVRLGLFLLICLASSLWGYITDIFTDPCSGLFYLDRKKYSAVYQSVNEISRKIRGPKIHAIYLSNEFNAAATSYYTLTPFRRNVLVLGYPLVCSMSYNGLSGCLAHEIGHLKHNHMSVGMVFMIIQTFWTNIHLGILSLLFIPWLKYWLPALQNAARPLFRKHEIQADEYIIQSLGGDYAAACQVEVTLKATWYSEVMDTLIPKVQEENWSQFDYAGYLHTELSKNVPVQQTEKILNRSMQAMQNVFDEHPSFSERLRLTGYNDPTPYAQFDADALEKYFQPDETFFTDLNTYFHLIMDPVSEVIRERFLQAEAWLDANPPTVTMDPPVITEALINLAEAGRKTQYSEFLEQCLIMYPENPELRARKALDIIKDYPEQAKVMLEESITQSPVLYLLDEDNFLMQYYMETGDTDKLKNYLLLREGRMESVEKDIGADLKKTDILLCNTLKPETEKALTELFRTQFQEIIRAYSVLRPIDTHTTLHVPFIILEYQPRWFHLAKNPGDILLMLNEGIGEFRFIYKKRDFCKNYLEPITGSCFYDRNIP